MATAKARKMKIFLIFFSSLFLIGCVQIQKEPSNPQRENVYFAHHLVGLHERENRAELRRFLNVDPVRTEWCAAFVNAVLYVNGVPGSESVSDNPLLARSFLDWGTEVYEPKMGDVVVFPRGRESWQGHVGFYVKTQVIDDIDYWVILGGNQDNQVSYELFPAYRAISVRRYSSFSNIQS
jgi:uncharacterized protein (TIGR02594 family)